MENFSQLILGIAIWGVLAYLFLSISFYHKLSLIKKKSVSHSRNSILGEVTEKITPLLPEFPYHTKDLVFIGKGADYIVFDGLSHGSLKEIIFLEIKSGTSQLNKNEAMIKNYLNKYPIKYEILKVRY